MSPITRGVYVLLTIVALLAGWWGVLYFQTIQAVRLMWAVAMFFSALAFLTCAMEARYARSVR